MKLKKCEFVHLMKKFCAFTNLCHISVFRVPLIYQLHPDSSANSTHPRGCRQTNGVRLVAIQHKYINQCEPSAGETSLFLFIFHPSWKIPFLIPHPAFIPVLSFAETMSLAHKTTPLCIRRRNSAACLINWRHARWRGEKVVKAVFVRWNPHRDTRFCGQRV